MIAANSPLNSAIPVIRAANPTRKHRCFEALCSSNYLGFSSSKRGLWVTRTRMDLLCRFAAGGCFRDPGHQGIKVEIDYGQWNHRQCFRLEICCRSVCEKAS